MWRVGTSTGERLFKLSSIRRQGRADGTRGVRKARIRPVPAAPSAPSARNYSLKLTRYSDMEQVVSSGTSGVRRRLLCLLTPWDQGQETATLNRRLYTGLEGSTGLQDAISQRQRLTTPSQWKSRPNAGIDTVQPQRRTQRIMADADANSRG
jgi:hypothetical protein